MPVNINRVLNEVEEISGAADPWSQLNTYLRLLQDQDAVATLAKTDAQTLYGGVDTLIGDLFNPGHRYSYASMFRGQPTTLRGRAAPFQVRPLASGSLPAGQVPFSDAAREARQITLRANPGQRLALRTAFQSNPALQGAVGGLRRRQAGGIRVNPFGQSHFSRMGDQSQQRLRGEASAYGVGRNAFAREIMGNTPASRGQQVRINPSYRRL